MSYSILLRYSSLAKHSLGSARGLRYAVLTQRQHRGSLDSHASSAATAASVQSAAHASSAVASARGLRWADSDLRSHCGPLETSSIVSSMPTASRSPAVMQPPKRERAQSLTPGFAISNFCIGSSGLRRPAGRSPSPSGTRLGATAAQPRRNLPCGCRTRAVSTSAAWRDCLA